MCVDVQQAQGSRVRVLLVSSVHMGGVRSPRTRTCRVHQTQAVFAVTRCVCSITAVYGTGVTVSWYTVLISSAETGPTEST
jgi:hypothetical protein